MVKLDILDVDTQDGRILVVADTGAGKVRGELLETSDPVQRGDIVYVETGLDESVEWGWASRQRPVLAG